MGRASTSWEKGQSGNPKGRPPKKRTLTEILAKSGSGEITLSNGDTVLRKQYLASLIWEFVTSGKVTFADGMTTLKAADAGEWIRAVSWLYNHIDGPPRAEFDVTTGGSRLSSGASLEDYAAIINATREWEAQQRAGETTDEERTE